MPRINKTDWLLESLMGPIILFDNLPTMEEAIARFRRHDYVVHEFDCSQHQSQETMFNAVLHSIGCLREDHFYKNIQTIQFWDLLRDIKISEESGVVLAFKNFDDFYGRLPESGQQMLSSIAREHFYELRHGLRLITLAHSENRGLKLEPLLTIKAQWSKHTTFTEEADRRAAMLRKYLSAHKEARDWADSQIESMPRLAVQKALLDVTGASSIDALLEMELDGAEMIRLLQDYDFTPYIVSEDKEKAARGEQRRRAASPSSAPEPRAE